VVRVATRIGFPITLEVTKEAVRRIRRTLSRDEGEDLIFKVT
jgi:enoyl-CoA hydratase